MGERVFKTLDQQLDILVTRGVNIKDEDRESAKDFLLKNNYYRISGYSLTLRNHDVFYDNVTFQNIVDIYNFDHKLRHILLDYLEVVEVQIKSVFAYEFTKQYGGTGYLDSNNFTNISEYLRIISKANEQRDKNFRFGRQKCVLCCVITVAMIQFNYSPDLNPPVFQGGFIFKGPVKPLKYGTFLTSLDAIQ